MKRALQWGILASVFFAISGFLAGCSDSQDNQNAPTSTDTFASFFVTLAPAQENPPTLSAADGAASFLVNTTTGAINGTVTTSGFTNSDAHIHAGEPGVNGPIIIPLTSAVAGTWTVPAGTTLTSAQLTSLTAGGLYVNVHSALYPGGQIRGQINRTVLTTRLTGTQENPPTTSTATGTGTFSVDPVSRALSARVVTTGMTATAAHIHTAPIGSNAGVTLGFNETAAGSGIWVPPAGAVFTADQYTAFLNGGMYFNVHSASFPSGEIRGQIGREIYDEVLVGAQENPPVVGGGTATSRIIVNPLTRELTGTVTNINVPGTAAHIHAGLFGLNAGVLIPTTQSAPGSNVWNYTPTTLTQAQYRGLLFGNWYSNTHSAAFPGGEARAQIGNIVRTGIMSGANEVPPNSSTAGGRGRATLNPNTLDISVTVITNGMSGQAAHLHLGALGANGPVIVPLTEGPVGTWNSAPGAKLTKDQAIAFAAGGTYFNAHSATLPSGEVRAQAIGLD